jgi:hypothetical protein
MSLTAPGHGRHDPVGSLKVPLGCVDHLFRLGVNVMYHEAMYLVVQHV